MRVHQRKEKRARRRFQVILGLSVLIPCALLGALAVHILRLRKNLEPEPSNPRYFVTLHGVGYTLLYLANP